MNSHYGIRPAKKITTASVRSVTQTLMSSSSVSPLTHQIPWTTSRKRFASAVPLSSPHDSTCLQWVSEVQHFCHGLPIILVGCKKDLRRDPRVIEELKRVNQRPVTPEEVRQVSTVFDDRSLMYARACPWLKGLAPGATWSVQHGQARASGKSSSTLLVRPS